MFYRFRYESGFYATLSRVPLHLRMKLDLAGVKFSLKDWLAFSIEERSVLCHFPIDAEEERQAFIAYLGLLSRRYRGEPLSLTAPIDSSLWDNSSRVPKAVDDKSTAINQPVAIAEWARWDFCQRYALYKTAVSKNEPEAFFEVLKELRERTR